MGEVGCIVFEPRALQSEIHEAPHTLTFGHLRAINFCRGFRFCCGGTFGRGRCGVQLLCEWG